MDEVSLVIAVEPLADDMPTDVGDEDIYEDILPDAGDGGEPSDDGFVWDDGTIDGVVIDDGSGTLDDGTIDDGTIDGIIIDDRTLDEGMIDDGGIIDAGGSGEDELIGDDASDEDWLVDDGSWVFVEIYASEDDAEWEEYVATDPIFWCAITLEEPSLDYEQLSRPMFDDKGLPDDTGTSTDGLIDPAICVCFPFDAIV